MALVLNVKHFVDRFAAFAGRRFRRILRLCPWSARRATPRVLAARHSDNDFGFTPEDGGVDQGSHPEVLALHVKIYGALKKWELTKMVAKILTLSDPENSPGEDSWAYPPAVLIHGGSASRPGECRRAPAQRDVQR